MEQWKQRAQLDAGTRIGPQIKRLSNAFHQCVNRSCEFSGLTGVQTWVVSYVVLHPEQAIYAKTLEQVLHLKHPTICGILQRLEAKNFIVIEPDRADRRCKRIRLTDRARRCDEAVRHAFETLEQLMCSGMSEEEQQRVFGEFERLSNAATQDGFGLGLSIVKRIVDMMHGKIRLESEKGRGSGCWNWAERFPQSD